MPVIDVHAHIIPRSAVRAFDAGADWFGTRITKTADGKPTLQTGSFKMTLNSARHWLSPAERLAYLDEDRIDVQVLSLSPQLARDALDRQLAIECTKVVNDEIAETVAEFPDRFAGLASLPLQDTEASVKELERAMQDLGLRGMIIGSHVAGANWDEPRLFPILEAAERLGAFILLHPFNNRIREPLARYHLVNLIGNPVETTIAAASLILGGVLDRLPDLKICLAHAGGYLPFGIGRFDHAYRERDDVSKNAASLPSEYLRRFYYDCISHSEDGLERVLDAVGADRILIGTDFPADMGLRRPVDWLEGLSFLSDAERAAIEGGNAQMLGFEARKTGRRTRAAAKA